MYICSQTLLSVLLSKYSVIKGNRSVPSKFMSDIEYSVITSDVMKSFDCIMVVLVTCKYEEDPIKKEGARVLTRFSPL